MNFKTDLSKLLLLGNKTINLIFDDKIIKFNPPSMELLFSYDFLQMKTLLKTDPKSIDTKQLGFIVENEYELFLAFLKLAPNSEIILENFNKIFPNINFINNNLICNDSTITYEEFMLMNDLLDISCGDKDLNSFLKEQSDEKKEKKNSHLSDLEKRMKENEEKLKKIKEDKKGNQDSITIDQIVIAIIYEFPGLKIDDVFKMNFYSVLELWKYISKIVDTKIQIVAAGNGLIKDFTYFIN